MMLLKSKTLTHVVVYASERVIVGPIKEPSFVITLRVQHRLCGIESQEALEHIPKAIQCDNSVGFGVDETYQTAKH